ncbi:hypothetical protein C475_18746 [Halosimplex carlsbadense 2-9-1]|uniref:Uncharacterized protein n=1 Tax=Halosimplex carlsbadense 2-9-1 TaxID=797114 RepID=M0CE04_9EURY|nr:hypothetical protein [Halosimplex carlsbadense]ELZ21485.1 hypothetical protein C475_18746 [Halosimplex carlsbadense 2-9-1]
MSLSEDERESLDALLSIFIHTIAENEELHDDRVVVDHRIRDLAIGFCAGFLYYRRRGQNVGTSELNEIEELVYDRSSDLRRAIEQAGARSSHLN